jgi:uncharacterized protein (DUF1697 family)
MAKTERSVALLRGVNVGGNNKVPMKDLVRLVEGLGCADVVTYIQSGNVVLSAPSKVALALPQTLARAIEKELGVKSPVIVRSAKELRRVWDGNPFLERGESASACHVAFLADAPSKAADREARSESVAGRRARRPGARSLLVPSERRRPIEADERLDRSHARHDEHQPQLAHGREARRHDGEVRTMRPGRRSDGTRRRPSARDR